MSARAQQSSSNDKLPMCDHCDFLLFSNNNIIIIIGDGGCTSAEISGEEGFHSCEAGGHQGPGGAR